MFKYITMSNTSTGRKYYMSKPINRLFRRYNPKKLSLATRLEIRKKRKLIGKAKKLVATITPTPDTMQDSEESLEDLTYILESDPEVVPHQQEVPTEQNNNRPSCADDLSDDDSDEYTLAPCGGEEEIASSSESEEDVVLSSENGEDLVPLFESDEDMAPLLESDEDMAPPSPPPRIWPHDRRAGEDVMFSSESDEETEITPAITLLPKGEMTNSTPSLDSLVDEEPEML
jgi:hypothetical protein